MNNPPDHPSPGKCCCFCFAPPEFPVWRSLCQWSLISNYYCGCKASCVCPILSHPSKITRGCTPSVAEKDLRVLTGVLSGEKQRKDSIQPFLCLPASWWDTGGSELRSDNSHKASQQVRPWLGPRGWKCVVNLFPPKGQWGNGHCGWVQEHPFASPASPCFVLSCSDGRCMNFTPNTQKPHTCSYQEISRDCRWWQCSRQCDVENTQRCSQSILFSCPVNSFFC